MALRAMKPEEKQKRLKIFVYGMAGIGKTTAAIQFPQAVIIDTERGTDAYAKSIIKAGSVVFQSSVFDEAAKEVKELLTTKHGYRTLIIDPVTQLYNSVQEKWTKIFERHSKTEKEAEVQDFGMRYWSKVKSEFKSFQRMLMSIDMNLIITAHQKDMYGNGMQKIGVTFDSMKGDDYLFDYVFHLQKKGDKRIATTIKERAEPNEQKFPEEFEWSYENFCKFYGSEIIQKESRPLTLATEEQIAEIQKFVELVKIDEETINKWLTKANVDNWAEMQSDELQKCIDYVKKKVSVLK